MRDFASSRNLALVYFLVGINDPSHLNRSGDERESGGERGVQGHDRGHGHHLLPLRAAAILAEGTVSCWKITL